MSSHTSAVQLRGMLRSFWRGLAACALILSAALFCSSAWAGTLEGTATFRERIALPPDAVFEVELQDVSRADTPAVVLGRSKLDPAGQPPFHFEIVYDDDALRSGHRYTARASVKQQGRLLFTTDQIYPVLEGRNAPLSMLLVFVHGGPVQGSMGEGIGVLPGSNEGELPRAGESCGSSLAESPLRGTYWKLVRLEGNPVAAAEKQREAHLVFAIDALRVAGSAGCNRVAGGFELEGDGLRFSQMATTMMSCPDGMDQERRFLEALERVEHYRIRGSRLELLDGTGAVIAGFDAVALK